MWSQIFSTQQSLPQSTSPNLTIANTGPIREVSTIRLGTHHSVQIMESSGVENQPPINKRPSVNRMVEDVVGCKWSLSVLDLIAQGINRPGAMERSLDGLTTKVLNERLKKLVNYGILHRHAYPEIPPRVEYALTDFGQKFVRILDEIHKLNQELENKHIQPHHR